VVYVGRKQEFVLKMDHCDKKKGDFALKGGGGGWGGVLHEAQEKKRTGGPLLKLSFWGTGKGLLKKFLPRKGPRNLCRVRLCPDCGERVHQNAC